MDQYALKNFSITIHTKTKLAVVGLNGAGKRTFVKLLLRLYDPAELCLRKAGLANKLDEWEKGLETQMMKIIHNDGVNLSGEEMQKMGLAKALYKDTTIVVLDKPTAALNPVSEYEI